MYIVKRILRNNLRQISTDWKKFNYQTVSTDLSKNLMKWIIWDESNEICWDFA